MESEGASLSSLKSNNVSVVNVNSDAQSQESYEHETESGISNRQVTKAQHLVKSKVSPEQLMEDLGTSPNANSSYLPENSHSTTQQSSESPSNNLSPPPPSPNPNMSEGESEDMRMEVEESNEAAAVVHFELENETRRKEEMQKEQDGLNKACDEEKRFVDDLLNRAINSIWARIKGLIERQIREQINLENYTQLNRELLIHYNNFPIIAQVPPHLRSKFVQTLKYQCTQLHQRVTVEIIGVTDAFKTKIMEYFSNHLFLPEDSLQQVLLNDCLIISNQLGDEFIRAMFHQVYHRFYQIFMQHNQIIANTERILYEIVKDKAVSFYNQEMSCYVAEGPYSPQMLTGIHENLVEKLKDYYLDALCSGRGPANSDVLQAKENLSQSLQQAFLSHLTGNETKLKELNQKVNKIICSCKDGYTAEIEQFLTNNPDGVPDSKLEDEHNRLVTKMGNILEAKIELDVRPNEPVEVHAEVLKDYTKKYFQVVLEANKKNLEKATDKNKVSSEDLLEPTATQQSSRRKENEYHVNRNPLPLTLTVPNSKKQDELPPLVLEFKDCSHFVMAIRTHRENKKLTNEFGETETKATVGFIHGEEQFIYGSQVPDKNVTKGNSMKRWDLDEYLICGKYEFDDKLTINSTDYIVSFEFVLGFILRKLKKAAEKQVDKKLSSAVITIPFWLSSTQRVQMKDGAKLAGFSDVYLVNEVSAAAYACLSDKLWGTSNEALVAISVHRNRVDTFVYQSSGGSAESTKVKMLAHHNSWNDSKKQKISLMNLLNKVTSLWSSTDEFDSITKSIQNSIKYTLKKASAKFQSRKVLTISGSASEEQSEMFDKVATEFGKRIQLEDSVLHGALLLSVDPEKIRVNISDLISSKVRKQSSCGHTFGACRRNLIPCELDFYVYQGNTHFFQNIDELDTQIRIGTLSVENLIPNQRATVILEVDNEEIIKCKDVRISAMSYRGAVTRQNQQVCKLEWKWSTPTLPEDRFSEIASWLDHLIPSMSPEQIEIIQVKQSLLQKCTDMNEKIDNQVLYIKSNLIRGVVKDKIAEAQRFAEHQNTCLDDLREQSEVLDKLYQKYSKK